MVPSYHDHEEIYTSAYARVTAGGGEDQEVSLRNRGQTAVQLVVYARSIRTGHGENCCAYLVTYSLTLLQRDVVAGSGLQASLGKRQADLVG